MGCLTVAWHIRSVGICRWWVNNCVWWNNGAVWIAWPLVSVCQLWFCLDLIPLKSESQTKYIALPYNTRASTLWTPFGGGILGCQRESHATTTLQHGSIWAGFRSSVVKVTDKRHILSMIRSINISQTGKGSTVVKMGTLQYCSSWPSICRGAKNSS